MEWTARERWWRREPGSDDQVFFSFCRLSRIAVINRRIILDVDCVGERTRHSKKRKESQKADIHVGHFIGILCRRPVTSSPVD
jgi:hypothetical protein